MLKDHRDEAIALLKRKNAELEDQLKQLGRQNQELQRGDGASEAKLRAANEVHAQKVKALLRSIQLLKKEVQREKLEKKDNVRAQKIEALNRDIQYCEVAINALRRLVNSEDACDQAIKNALDKGPKRIRVASREELKMDVNKYKNMTLRLLEVLRQHGLTQPPGCKVDAAAGTGLKEEKKEEFDINDLSAQASDTGADAGDGPEEKARLEEAVVKLNLELKEKNEKLLELLEELEEVRIQVYARDKSITLQQKQVEDLLEELRDARAGDGDAKALLLRKLALEEENQRLRKELDEKFVVHTEKQLASNELSIENKSLGDQVRALSKALEQAQQDQKQRQAKLDQEKAAMLRDLAAAKAEAEAQKKAQAVLKKQSEALAQRLSTVDGQAQGVLGRKEEDLDAYRKKCLELGAELQQKDAKVAELQGQVVELSN